MISNEFLSYNIKAIDTLKDNSKDKKNRKTYNLLRRKYVKKIMSIVPTKLIEEFLDQDLLYDNITYYFEKDKFFLEKENPFKY